MSNPGLYQETHWRFPILFTDSNGEPRDMSGRVWLAEMFAAGGVSVFKWKSAGAASNEGTIDTTDAANGIVILDATVLRHAAALAGKPYTWTLYDVSDPADPVYLANGRAVIGVPGASTTVFQVLWSPAETKAQIVLSGPPGPPGPAGGGELQFFDDNEFINAPTDDSDATAIIQTLLGHGGRWSGRGKSYSVSPAAICINLSGLAAWIEDATFALMSPATAKILYCLETGAQGPTLKRVKVDYTVNPRTGGHVQDMCGIEITGADHPYLEDCEVTGNGKGHTIRLINCTKPQVIHPYVHDIQWYNVGNPGTEQINGVRFDLCIDIECARPEIKNLLGEMGWKSGEVISASIVGALRSNGVNAYRASGAGTTAAPGPTHVSGTVADGGGVLWDYIGAAALAIQPFQTRGLAAAANLHFGISGGMIEKVGQGVDISGSGSNRNGRVIGVTAIDCDTWGFKAANSTQDVVFIGCLAIRAAASGFVASGRDDASDQPFGSRGIRFIGCEAIDTGASGHYPAGNVAGFSVAENGAGVLSAHDVIAIDCIAVDRQSVPTMKYGFYNEPNNEFNFKVIGCTVEGETISKFERFNSGGVFQFPSGPAGSGSHLVGTGSLLIPIWTTALRCVGIRSDARSTLALVDQVPPFHLAALSSPFVNINGLTAAFSIGSIAPTETDGETVVLYNSTVQQMTVVNEDATEATFSRRIKTLTGADIVLAAGNQSMFQLRYHGGISRWVVTGHSP